MPKYMFLMQQPSLAHRDVSPEEMQRIIQKYTDWRRRLEAQNRYIEGRKLHSSARTLRRVDGELQVVDGPYIEGKELLAGYFLIEADNYDHAVELARDTPHFEYGTLEIREVEFE